MPAVAPALETDLKSSGEVGVATAPASGGGEGDIASAPRERYEIENLRAEAARLDEARRELLGTLEQRTRRADQLVGERDQLERQLIRAEGALQELNRQLGALAPRAEVLPAARTPRHWPALRDRLRTRLTRLWPGWADSNGAAARPALRGERPPAQDPSGPLVPFAEAGQGRRVIVVVAVGLEPEQRASVLDLALRLSAEHGVVPLVLTDDDDFAPLRRRGMLFEYFPPGSVREALAPALEWELYLQRRLALIRRKWRPMRVVAFGGPAADLVRLWSDSPFEETPFAALPKAPPAVSGAARARV